MKKDDKLRVIKRLAKKVQHLEYEYRRNDKYRDESPSQAREQAELDGYIWGMSNAILVIALMPENQDELI